MVYEERPQSTFPTRPTAIYTIYCMKRQPVRDRVMTSHDTCTSGYSRVLTVALLQRLKMETLIPALADCEVRSVIKFLNTRNLAPIEIHRQLCQVYGQTRPDGQRISCRSSVGRCLIFIHPIGRISRPVISIFSRTSKNSYPVSVSRMTERRWWVHSGSNARRQTSLTQDTKVGPSVWQLSQFRWWICRKIAQHLLYLLQ